MNTYEIPLNLLIQYILVALIIAGAVAWVIWKISKGRKKKDIGCSGCSLADTCIKAKDVKKRSTATGNNNCNNCYGNTPCCNNNLNTNIHEDNKNME